MINQSLNASPESARIQFESKMRTRHYKKKKSCVISARKKNFRAECNRVTSCSSVPPMMTSWSCVNCTFVLYTRPLSQGARTFWSSQLLTTVTTCVVKRSFAGCACEGWKIHTTREQMVNDFWSSLFVSRHELFSLDNLFVCSTALNIQSPWLEVERFWRGSDKWSTLRSIPVQAARLMTLILYFTFYELL